MVASRLAFVPSGFGIRRKVMPAASRRASTCSMSGRFESRLVVSNSDEIGDLGDGGLGGLSWHDCS
jgi:hypothetical protein